MSKIIYVIGALALLFFALILCGVIGWVVFLDGQLPPVPTTRYSLNGDWQRVSPPAEMGFFGGSNLDTQSADIACAIVSPSSISFFKDGKYTANGALFAGGDFLVVKKGAMRLQTVRGLETVRYAVQNSERQLTLTFNSINDVDCTATYKEVPN